MASTVFMPFLRPLPPPRVAFVRSFQRALSTQSHLRQAAISHASKTTTSPPPPPPVMPADTPSSLAYHVHRTASQQLPIYHLAKRGGNLHQTRIRKIEGDVELLRNEIKTTLGLKEELIVINRLTGHIIIKGWYRDRIKKFLEERQF